MDRYTYAVLDSFGIITNRVVGQPVLQDGASYIIEDDQTLEIGGTVREGIYTPPPRVLVAPFLPAVVSVSPRQARLALSAAGLLAQVNAIVRTADEQTQITWDYALSINRTDPMIEQIATALGLSETQVDDLFAAAAML